MASKSILSVKLAMGVASIHLVRLVSARISDWTPSAKLAISGESVELANYSMAAVALMDVETFKFQKSMYSKKFLYSSNWRY